VGAQGQALIRRGHVAVVGLGALGCSAVDLLARAGVERLTLIDRDVVEWTNLQRQTLYSEEDARAGLPKAEAAAARVAAINSDVVCVPVVADVTASSVERVVGLTQNDAVRVIVDATDNLETRFLLNDASVKHGVALAYGGVIGTRGMHATFVPGGPCLRCVFDGPGAPGSVATCETAGVLGSAVAMVAAAQVVDTLKVLMGKAVERTLTDFDAWNGRRRVVELGPRDEGCSCCAARRFDFLGRSDGGDGAALCGQNAVQVGVAAGDGLDLDALAARLGTVGRVERTRFMLRFMPRESAGLTVSVFADGRAIVHGTTSAAAARTVYARWVGV
jgi:adenylyltransferase/sulfurtransferase